MKVSKTLKRFYHLASVPSAALLGAFCFAVMRDSLSDPDYYWHLETGRHIVNDLSLPRMDLFSFTAADHSWVPHEWLFQAMLYLSYSSGGYLGTKILAAVFGSAMILVVYGAIRRLLNDAVLALGLTFGFFVGMLPGMTPRPHLVTYLCFAVYLTTLLELKYLGRTKYLWVLPVLMVLWVNAHGGYIIGLILLVVFIAAERLSISLSDSGTPERRNNLGKLVLVAGACVIASLCNPDFYHHWLYPFAIVNMQATNMLTDWASPTFRTRYGLLILLTIGCYAVVFMMRRKPPDVTEVLVPGMLIALAFQSQRNIPFALFAAILFSAAGLTRQQAKNTTDAVVGAGSTMTVATIKYGPAAAWILLAMISIVAVMAYPKAHAIETRSIRLHYPVDAADFVVRAGLVGRLFNEYDFGGYLIHRLQPQKVFIDGRADVYGDALIFEWSKIRNGDPDWRRLFESYQIDYVILKRRAPLRQLLLEGDAFVLVHDDQTASVLVRYSQRYAEIIEKYRIEQPDQ